MSELEEVALVIQEKRLDKGNLTLAEARALAYLQLPLGETQQIIDGVADELMKFNVKG